MKDKLLQKEEREQFKVITIGEFNFKVLYNISGLQLYHIEKQVAEITKSLSYIQDDKELVHIPDEVKYMVGLLHFLVEEPKLTVEEWALVFNRKPHLFLVLSKRVADLFFGSGDITYFFSDELLSDALNNG